MNKIEELYKFRESFPDILTPEQWKEKEEALLQEEFASRIKEAMETMLSGVKSPLSIIVDYDPVTGTSVAINKVKDIEEDSEDETDEDDDTEESLSRSPSVGFSVEFSDGTLVKLNNAKETFIATLKVIGLARVAAFRGRTFKGYALVGREHRPPIGKWQKYVDGWYVYTNMSNDTKVTVLRQISAEMKLGLTIRDDDGNIYVCNHTSSSSKKKGKRAMFRLNGQGPYNKRQFVYAAVKMYLGKYPNVTYEELEKAFPRELQGSYGVIARMSFIKNKQQNGYEFMGRYFTDDSLLLQTKDGVIFAVCTQWGDQFPNVLNNVRRFGWTVSEE